ncbi:hypothetical protein EV363DRAFT_36578 [Boletus edulis]|nr:hypothetical protein EV363DRAFT_36578 [Boletus edulis]
MKLVDSTRRVVMTGKARPLVLARILSLFCPSPRCCSCVCPADGRGIAYTRSSSHLFVGELRWQCIAAFTHTRVRRSMQSFSLLQPPCDPERSSFLFRA